LKFIEYAVYTMPLSNALSIDSAGFFVTKSTDRPGVTSHPSAKGNCIEMGFASRNPSMVMRFRIAAFAEMTDE
jgi:hypothetical protein